LFDRLVWTVMGYEIEIWGWKEKEELEKLEKKYLRWVLGVDGKTSWYLVKEELQRGKLRERTGRRAWNFEKKLEEERGGIIARRCWEEMRERERRGRERSDWEKEIERFWEERGTSIREVEEKREQGNDGFWETEGRKKRGRGERDERGSRNQIITGGTKW